MDWVGSLLILFALLLVGLASGLPVAFTFFGISFGGLYLLTVGAISRNTTTNPAKFQKKWAV